MKFVVVLAVALVAIAVVEAGYPPLKPIKHLPPVKRPPTTPKPPCCDDVECNCCPTQEECEAKGGVWVPGTKCYPSCCPRCLVCTITDLCAVVPIPID